MSSSIYNQDDSWDVSNQVFWRVLDFANEVGNEIAQNETELEWLKILPTSESDNIGSTPDINAAEIFSTPEAIDFWIKVLEELARRVFDREIGSNEDTTWQVPTIWAVHGLTLFLRRVKVWFKLSQQQKEL
jgi:hypothetical protein